MGACLSPCPSCARHIRADEGTCPFCGAATPEGFGACVRPAPAGPVLSRAAVLFMGATAVAACGGTTTTVGGGGDSGSSADSMPVAMDGPAPVRDSSVDAPVDSPGPVPAYGPGPTRDSGEADQAADQDSGGVMTLYGPGPVDSGTG